MKKNTFLSFLSLLLIPVFGFGQQASLSIGTVDACDSTEIAIPVTMENFYDVGAISLYIGYDTTELEFTGLQNIHPAFGGLLYNAMTYPSPQVGISWTSLAGASVSSGVFFEMVFEYSGNATELAFNPGCEIVNSDLEVIEVNYTGGSVNPLIQLTMQPEDVQVTAPESVQFQIISQGGENFKWQISGDEGATFEDLINNEIYQGANSEALSITSTTPGMNGNIFRCQISAGECTKYSGEAMLSVEGAVQEIELSAGWNSLSTYVTPTNDNLESVFADIMGSLVVLITDDGFFYPAAHTNTIGKFDPSKGYSLKLTNDETLSISGIRSENNQIDLPTGWGYLPVITECNITITDLFGPDVQDVIIIKEIAGNKVFWPATGINTLQILESGKSYLVKSSTAISITFPDCE